MKKSIMRFLSLFLFAAFAFISCDSSSSDPVVNENTPTVTNPVQTAYMKAKVDGQSINYTSATAWAYQNSWTLTGYRPNVGTLDLNIPVEITPGTYPLEVFTDYSASFVNFDEISFFSEMGTLIIISNDNGWVKGTFEFEGIDIDENPHTISDGEFNIKY